MTCKVRAQNRDLSALVAQMPAQSKAVAAPRLVHALVSRRVFRAIA